MGEGVKEWVSECANLNNRPGAAWTMRRHEWTAVDHSFAFAATVCAHAALHKQRDSVRVRVTGRQADRQADRQTDRQAGRQASRERGGGGGVFGKKMCLGGEVRSCGC